MAKRRESPYQEWEGTYKYDYFEDVISYDWSAEQERQYAAGMRFSDAIKPTLCAERHEIPSLLNKSIFAVSALLNSTVDFVAQQSVITHLPSNIIERIIPQLSFTTVRRLYGEDWPQFLEHSQYRTLLACMKNEEDVYRFLYYHNAAHPQLMQDIILNVFEQRPVLTYESLPVDEPLICRAHNKGFYRNYSHQYSPRVPDFSLTRGDHVIAERSVFDERWQVYTQGMFAALNWDHLFVAGGSVLHCLRAMKYSADDYATLAALFQQFYSESDIDLYIYGLDEAATKAKVIEIYNCVNKVFKELYVCRSKNTFTLFAENMRPVQIIATMYKSVAEILLSFDLGCIMVGFDGKNVRCLPRFMVSMKYLTNHLDSDMNLSNKLQWFRLQKYAVRGFHSALPTAFRFHGLSGFDQPFPSPDDIRSLKVNISLKKIVEIMSLSKLRLLEQTLPNFLLNYPYLWNARWHQGFSFNLSRSSLDEERALKNWGIEDATDEFKNLQLTHLTSTPLGSFWTEPPSYPDSPLWAVESSDLGSAVSVYEAIASESKAKSSVGLTELLQNTEITSFTESILQCYYLDAVVECKKCGRTTEVHDSQNPYCMPNSALSTIDYTVQSCDFELNNLTHSTVGTIESDMLSLGGSYWRVMLEIPKKGNLLWLKLKKLENIVDTHAKTLGHYFVNFVLSFKNTDSTEPCFDMHFDGSFIFKNEEELEAWQTFIYRPYIFKPEEFDVEPLNMPHIVGNLVQSSVTYLHDSSMLGKLTMQFHVPKLEVINI